MRIYILLFFILLLSKAWADTAWIKKKIATMSIEEKIGQLFIIGIHGKKINSSSKKKIRDIKPGGIILFGTNIRNPFQTSILNYELQSYQKLRSSVPLFLSIDQEGGLVTRIKSYPRLPSALSIGKAGDLSLAKNIAFESSKVLRGLGFNINFAPVLDISSKDHKDFIGTRAFSADKEEVSHFAKAYLSSYKKAKILGVAKHFPGHGEIVADSHFELPVLDFDKKKLLLHSTLPYQRAKKAGVLEAIMVGHLAIPSLDSRGVPATFSRPIITSFLRKDLKYDGLVVTDDIEMSAAGISKDPGIRALKAFMAGADMIMIAWNKKSQYRAHKFLVNAYKNGMIPQIRLNKSLHRILRLKQKYAKDKKLSKPQKDQIKSLVKNRKLAKLIRKVHQINFNKQKTVSNLYKNEKKIFLFSTEQPKSKVSKKRIRFIKLHKGFSINKLERIIMHINNQITVYHISGVQTSRLLKKIDPKLRQKIIVINTAKPSLVSKANSYKATFQLYSKVSNLASFLVNNNLFKRTISSEK